MKLITKMDLVRLAIAAVGFATIISLTSCGRVEQVDTFQKQYVDPEFDQYVASFEADAAKYGKPLTVTTLIHFGNPAEIMGKSNIVGVCIGNKNEIQIDRVYWDYMNKFDQFGYNSMKKELIYHELGHCVLGRGHRDDMTVDANNNEVPVSIMHFSLFYPNVFNENVDGYIKELFTNN